MSGLPDLAFEYTTEVVCEIEARTNCDMDPDPYQIPNFIQMMFVAIWSSIRFGPEEMYSGS